MPCLGATEEQQWRRRVLWPGITGLVYREQATAIIVPVERTSVDLHQIPVGDYDGISCHSEPARNLVSSDAKAPKRDPSCKYRGMTHTRRGTLVTSGAVLSRRSPRGHHGVSEFGERAHGRHLDAIMAIVAVEEHRSHADAKRPDHV